MASTTTAMLESTTLPSGEEMRQRVVCMMEQSTEQAQQDGDSTGEY